MTTPGDESRTELAWREIVDNYGERVVLPDDDASGSSPATPSSASSTDAEAEAPGGADAPLPDHLVDDDEVEIRERAIAEAERFRPPPAPPFPVPRTWQRGLAWAGIFVAPLLALVVALFSLWVTPLVGWALVGWFVGGFAYLVHEMPRGRDPWDDGSRV
ncbi:hypothetical protein CFI00_14740 [Nocardioides sp. S5]|uniref:hypothetical protein n=1 Tax=Nocardioides sp. S5 TaxID=2017486 RepID=UPI001A90C595|nr:hypothetical protein [Nocardioides sp. S5]QSR31739.1 hypothetical protein CFI00_14740 [Nocardioides sp. S5]